MEPEELILRGIAGMHGSIEERQKTIYGVQGERKPGEEFQYNGKAYVVREVSDLKHNGIIYNCACFSCVMNEHCIKDFQYASGECYHKWRKDGKSVNFILKEEDVGD